MPIRGRFISRAVRLRVTWQGVQSHRGRQRQGSYHRLLKTNQGERMRSHFKSLLAENRLLRVCALGQLCHPKLMEMIGWHGGFDAVWLDQEHVGLTMPQIEEAARAARAVGIDAFVRLHA